MQRSAFMVAGRKIGGGLSAAKSFPCLPPMGRQGRLGLPVATVLAALALAASITSVDARSINEKQKNLLTHGANAIIITQHCPMYQLNTELYGAAMLLLDVTAADVEPGGDFSIFAVSATAKAMDAVNGKDELVVCAIGKTLYGPGGQNVPNLLKKKGE